eukprot:TRINITY_DN7516_c0_g1_i2.p2 TRINITY_DN7516_c0_g1~~TRINITY_DN7516_c0_g1_i2.p2  ORF type:complete len:178 (+),score=14.82 TRINITY_DN7516_c0_g1_i2:653-1186(+)
MYLHLVIEAFLHHSGFSLNVTFQNCTILGPAYALQSAQGPLIFAAAGTSFIMCNTIIQSLIIEWKGQDGTQSSAVVSVLMPYVDLVNVTFRRISVRFYSDPQPPAILLGALFYSMSANKGMVTIQDVQMTDNHLSVYSNTTAQLAGFLNIQLAGGIISIAHTVVSRNVYADINGIYV